MVFRQACPIHTMPLKNIHDAENNRYWKVYSADYENNDKIHK
jgi:hypothetical protein